LGFRRGVRNLFHDVPNSSSGWPPSHGVIDRDLDIAISQFAPAAQTVKDDHLYTAVGIADFRPSRRGFTTAPDPLGRVIPVGVCRQCQALVETPARLSPARSVMLLPVLTANRIVSLSEPPAFMTWWSIDAEFSGGFEFTPRALRARMGAATNSPVARLNFFRGPTRPSPRHIASTTMMVRIFDLKNSRANIFGSVSRLLTRRFLTSREAARDDYAAFLRPQHPTHYACACRYWDKRMY
jgi:hypothetical protein